MCPADGQPSALGEASLLLLGIWGNEVSIDSFSVLAVLVEPIRGWGHLKSPDIQKLVANVLTSMEILVCKLNRVVRHNIHTDHCKWVKQNSHWDISDAVPDNKERVVGSES